MINSTIPKSKSQTTVEYILLAFCLCILALRITFTEGPGALSSSMLGNISDVVYSLSVSGVLIFSCILYFLLAFCRRRFSYRSSGIEFGLLLFCTASVIASFAASDKRLAITNAVMLLAPLLMVILLVQILDGPSKINLVLCVIGALGVVSACESIYQLLVTNQATIEQYERAPQTFMEPLGIEPGTFQQFLFEHRLYTGGVRAFFTTRNSAGCFMLMAIFAAFALFIKKLNNHKEKLAVPQGMAKLIKPGAKNLNPYLLTGGAALIIIILGLILTKSKGAIIGSLFAAILSIVYYFFGKQLKEHKKAILIACLLLVATGGCLVVLYGLKHKQLPGGTGMLVRWQYWQASAKMCADHPFTGVGPGNFKIFYPHYKPAEALESVADPHNFLLSILTQYGPIGLAGFLAMIFIPLWRVIFPALIKNEGRAASDERRVPAIIFLIIISAVLLLIRPMILAETPADTLELKIFVMSTIYIAPVLAFIAGFLLLSVPLHEKSKIESRKSKISIALLWCVILGVLLNNLIDYAIFEPGVYTTFWVIIACMIATDLQTNPKHTIVVTTKLFTKVTAVISALVIIAAYIGFTWLPVFKSTTRIQQAHKALSIGLFQQAHALFAEASEYDKLDPTALNMNGRLYLQQYSEAGQKQSGLLKNAEECFKKAITRNKADFKNYEKLSEVYELLGQLQKAYDWCLEAIQLYPGSDRLHFKLAQIAEKLGKTDIAIEQYKKTIEIENSFRRQFKMMYPERKEIVSRLGEEKYKFAIKKIKELESGE
jgi:tetratricopeptide (TPR) repeat protein/O-antigen ligase